jgi:hypothetical protein
VVLMACLRRRKRGGKRKGRAASVTSFIGVAGGRGRRGGGVRGGVRIEESETGGERGALAWRSAVGTGSWPIDVCGRHARGVVPSRGGGVGDPWARGHSNRLRSLSRFQKFQMV